MSDATAEVIRIIADLNRNMTEEMAIETWGEMKGRMIYNMGPRRLESMREDEIKKLATLVDRISGQELPQVSIYIVVGAVAVGKTTLMKLFDPTKTHCIDVSAFRPDMLSPPYRCIVIECHDDKVSDMQLAKVVKAARAHDPPIVPHVISLSEIKPDACPDCFRIEYACICKKEV